MRRKNTGNLKPLESWNHSTSWCGKWESKKPDSVLATFPTKADYPASASGRKKYLEDSRSNSNIDSSTNLWSIRLYLGINLRNSEMIWIRSACACCYCITLIYYWLSNKYIRKTDTLSTGYMFLIHKLVYMYTDLQL